MIEEGSVLRHEPDPTDTGRRFVRERLSRTTLEMRAVQPDDLPLLYRWSTDPAVARSWMYRGATPSFEDFVGHLYINVLSQFVFVRKGRTVAVAALYDCSYPAERCSIRVLSDPLVRPSTAGVDAFVLLAHFAFSNFPFARLFVETNSAALTQFKRAIAMGWLTEEARLVNHERFGSDWTDLVFLSISRWHFEDPPCADSFTVTLPSSNSAGPR